MNASIDNRSWMRIAAAAAAVAAVTGALAAAPPAEAAGTCNLANGVLDVSVAGYTTIETAGGTIAISTANGPVTCTGGTPTTKNTEVIRAVDTYDNPATPAPLDGSSTLQINDPASFAPGRTPEDSPNRSEIEFVVNMNNGTEDKLLAIADPDYGATWLAGTTGANWNGDPDPDINLGSFDEIGLDGTRWADRISLRGGGAMGAPVSLPKVGIEAEEGDDVLLGGDAPDDLDGGLGTDTLSGFGGDDHLDDVGGDDSLAGGPGVDSLSLSAAKPAATVDLGTSAPQDTGAGRDSIDGVETVYATSGNDVLIGNESPNHLSGGGGDDTFDGRGAADVIDAYDGSDTVVYESSNSAVTVDLVTGRAQNLDATDTLFQVENVVGSPFADSLTGDNLANRIVGGAGVDTVTAAGGADRVEVRDGGADRVSCGDDAGVVDTVVGDRRGVDALNADCESLDLVPDPVEPGPGPGPGPQQPGGGGGQPLPGAGPRVTTLTVAPRSFRPLRSGASIVRRGGALATYRLSTRATVRFSVERLLPGRRAGTRCQAVTARNRRNRPCTRVVRVPGTFSRTGAAGVNRLRFSGRIAGRALRRGSYRLVATPVATSGRPAPARRAAFSIR